MRRLVLLIAVSALAACDHRPAPPQAHADVASPIALGSGGVQRAPVGDETCIPVAAKIAELVIAGTTDPTQKAAYEQDRVKLVKRFGDTCTREQWTDATRQCFLSATSTQAIEACTRELAKSAGGRSADRGSAGPGSAGPGGASGSAGPGSASGSAGPGSAGSGPH